MKEFCVAGIERWVQVLQNGGEINASVIGGVMIAVGDE
jgi:hypothetical protein